MFTMFIPLGLALKLFKVPIGSYLIILVCFGYYFGIQSKETPEKEISLILKEEKLSKSKEMLFEEYCLKQSDNPDVCKKDSNLNKNSKFTEKYKSITELISIKNQFENSLKINQETFANYKNYENFKQLEIEKNQKINKIHLKYNLLSLSNNHFSSILKAIFSHGSIMHLFGNMFMLFIFGRYVELRMGTIQYLVAYLVAGMIAISLYISLSNDNLVYIVGASANVSVIMGMFYIYFFDAKMKFWIFYFATRIISLNIKYYFFIFYIALELILTLSATTNVAHGAHAIGLMMGVCIALVWKKLYPLPPYFLYDFELNKWNDMNQTSELDKFIGECDDLLSYNPYNKQVRQNALGRILKEQDHSSLFKIEVYSTFLENQLPIYFDRVGKDHGHKGLFSYLEIFPLNYPIIKIFKSIGQRKILLFIDKAIDSNRLFAATKLIQIFFEKYPKSKKISNMKKTLESILENLEVNDELIRFLQFNSQSKYFFRTKKIFLNHLNSIGNHYGKN